MHRGLGYDMKTGLFHIYQEPGLKMWKMMGRGMLTCVWGKQTGSRSQGFTREEIVWIETEVSAEQSRPGSQGPVEKKKWGGCLARAKDKIQRLLTAWGFMQLQEKPPQTATIEINLPPDWNRLCFSRNLRSKERERHQLNKSSPALEGESQDETEEFSYTDLCRGVTRVCPGFL